MIKVYDVQTFYGTKQKTFQCRHHAEQYFRQLSEEYPDLVEFYERSLTEEEFCYENLDD